jgi:ribosome-binding protein aMBF1 (putative translation factor)
MRDRRMAEAGADEAYEAARLAFELGAAVRDLRLARGWSQSELASAARMTQSAIARFEAGERCRPFRCLRGSRERSTPI